MASLAAVFAVVSLLGLFSTVFATNIVAVGKNSFSDIYAFGHKDLDVVSEFVQVKTEANTLELTAGHFVPKISKVDKLGLYNPLTLSGNILVNNVVASVHSEWFLDSLFDALGASEYLPYAYQSLLAPVRALYNIAGSKLYSAGYSMLDSCVNVADSGTKYGGPIAITIGIGALAFAARSI
ncbi:hypothetical protein SELMODRAFT_432559 [Selaginella moellendorffii]|uniref:Hedgehog protein Hint domain-containing protein n=1 Tax=Selaginella moellendorffii TaxID=88036 RepID=D8TGD5_SELML|nr:hypothetical protein SELMODRAFT_432559 [Selaginella moellendorffii]